MRLLLVASLISGSISMSYCIYSCVSGTEVIERVPISTGALFQYGLLKTILGAVGSIRLRAR